MAAPKEDWQQERARVLAQARVVVVKVGSAVLTDANGLSMPVLENLAAQLAQLRNLMPESTAGVEGGTQPRRLVLVSSGAVAAGRAALSSRGHVVETTGLAARQARRLARMPMYMARLSGSGSTPSSWRSARSSRW